MHQFARLGHLHRDAVSEKAALNGVRSIAARPPGVFTLAARVLRRGARSAARLLNLSPVHILTNAERAIASSEPGAAWPSASTLGRGDPTRRSLAWATFRRNWTTRKRLIVLASKSVQQLIDNFDVARRATRAEVTCSTRSRRPRNRSSRIRARSRSKRAKHKLVSQAALTKQRILTSLNRKQILASLNAGIRHDQRREARQAKLAAARRPRPWLRPHRRRLAEWPGAACRARSAPRRSRSPSATSACLCLGRVPALRVRLLRADDVRRPARNPIRLATTSVRVSKPTMFLRWHSTYEVPPSRTASSHA